MTLLKRHFSKVLVRFSQKFLGRVKLLSHEVGTESFMSISKADLHQWRISGGGDIYLPGGSRVEIKFGAIYLQLPMRSLDSDLSDSRRYCSVITIIKRHFSDCRLAVCHVSFLETIDECRRQCMGPGGTYRMYERVANGCRCCRSPCHCAAGHVTPHPALLTVRPHREELTVHAPCARRALCTGHQPAANGRCTCQTFGPQCECLVLGVGCRVSVLMLGAWCFWGVRAMGSRAVRSRLYCPYPCATGERGVNATLSGG